jgi:hypothetical protein
MRLLRSTGILVAAFASRAAHACTVCDSPNGHQLRAALFNGHFLHTLLLVAAPVPVLVVAVLLLNLLLPEFAASGAETNSPEPLRSWYEDTLACALIAPEPTA